MKNEIEEKTEVRQERFSAVIFDLDGTLLYTLPDIARSVNAVLSRHGFSGHEIEFYRDIVGWGLYETMRGALPEDERGEPDVSSLADELMNEYHRHPVVHTVPYPGIRNMLETLNTLEVPLAVLSNKDHKTTVEAVALTVGSGHFELVRGKKDGVPAKPDPAAALEVAADLGVDPESLLYVGDSGVDMQTAVNAGFFPAGVLWGYKSREEIEEAGARILFKSPEELLQLFPPNKEPMIYS